MSGGYYPMPSGGGGMNTSWPQASHVTLTPTGSWAPSNPVHGVDPAHNDTPLVFNMSRTEPYVREGSGGRDKSVESGTMHAVESRNNGCQGIKKNICYWQISIIANSRKKRNHIKGQRFYIHYRRIFFMLLNPV